jgi:anti-anti-sigma factor
MQITTQNKGDVAVIHLAGKFDGGKDCEKIQAKITGFITEGRRKFVLSFSLIRFITSCGLGKLIAIHQEVTECGGRVILCNLERRPLSVIYTARLYEVFEVRKSLRQALAQFETVESETGN